MTDQNIVKKSKLPKASSPIKAYKQFDSSLTMLNLPVGDYLAGDIVYEGSAYRDFGDSYDYRNCYAIMQVVTHTLAGSRFHQLILEIKNQSLEINSSNQFTLNLDVRIKTLSNFTVESGKTSIGIQTQGYYVIVDNSVVPQY